MSPLTHETVVHSVHVLEACWGLIGTVVVLALLDEWRVRRRDRQAPVTAEGRPPELRPVDVVAGTVAGGQRH